MARTLRATQPSRQPVAVTSRRAPGDSESRTAPLVVRLRLDKVTAGAVRYMEVDDHGDKIGTDLLGAVVATIYLRKAALRKWIGEVPPSSLVVTISVE